MNFSRRVLQQLEQEIALMSGGSVSAGPITPALEHEPAWQAAGYCGVAESVLQFTGKRTYQEENIQNPGLWPADISDYIEVFYNRN